MITDVIFPPGYQILRKDRESRGERRILLLIKDQWSFKEKEELVRNVTDDYILQRLTGSPKVTIVVMYILPSNNRRSRQKYEESKSVILDTIAKVTRRAHMSRAKLTILENFNNKETGRIWSHMDYQRLGKPRCWK